MYHSALSSLAFLLCKIDIELQYIVNPLLTLVNLSSLSFFVIYVTLTSLILHLSLILLSFKRTVVQDGLAVDLP